MPFPFFTPFSLFYHPRSATPRVLFCPRRFARRRVAKPVHPEHPCHAMRAKNHEIEPISANNRAPPSATVTVASRGAVEKRGWTRSSVSGGAIRIYIPVKLNHIGARVHRPTDAHMHKEPIVSSYLPFCNISGRQAIRLIIF